MSDFEQMVQYWDNTGEWRKSYYTQLKNITSDKFSMAEKMERELDLAEYTAIDKIIKYKKQQNFSLSHKMNRSPLRDRKTPKTRMNTTFL